MEEQVLLALGLEEAWFNSRISHWEERDAEPAVVSAALRALQLQASLSLIPLCQKNWEIKALFFDEHSKQP